MEQQILQKIQEQDAKIDAIYESVEKTRKYMLTAVIVMALSIVAPLVGLAFVIPTFIKTYSSLGI